MQTQSYKFITKYPASLVLETIRRLNLTLPAHVEKDDVLQEGLLGLMKAEQTYNAEKGAAFMTWCVNGIRWRIYEYLTTECKPWRTFYPLYLTVIQQMIAPECTECAVMEMDGLESLYRAVSNLPEKEHVTIMRHYWYDETFPVIGKRFGVTGARVQQINQKAIRRLKEELI